MQIQTSLKQITRVIAYKKYLIKVSIFILLLISNFIAFGQNPKEIMPVFKTGDNDLLQFMRTNISYPDYAKDNCINGTVVLNFIVTKSGTIDSIKILNSIHKSLDNEAIRVIKLTSGLWSPGSRNDTTLNVHITYPIGFLMMGPDCKDANYYYNEGVKLSNENKFENAITNFISAIKLNPYDIDALYNCAVLKIKLNEIDDACKYLKKIKELNKTDADELISKYCN